jgi:hypothetical protein
MHVNGFDIGMYWPLVPTAATDGGGGGRLPGQRYYHVPPDCLREGANELAVLEEVGAPRPDLVRLATVRLAEA